MSASQEKKQRKEQREEGTEKRQVAEQKTSKEKKRSRLITAIVSVIVVVLVLAIIILNSSLFYRYAPAVKIGDESYSTAEFNYFYFSGYYSFVNQYSSYISYFLDTSKPLSSQQYDDDTTWADYFQNSAIDTMTQVTALYNDAKAEGFTISDEYQEELDSALTSLKDEATSNGYKIDKYCSTAFGKGSNYDLVEKMMTKYYYAMSYAQSKYDGFTYTDDELETYYDEHKDEYDYIDYRYYLVSGSVDEDSDITEEEAMSQAQEIAQAIVDGASDDDSFTELVQKYVDEDSADTYSDPDATLYHTQGQSLNSAFSSWLLDSERSYGDTEIFDATDGYYAVMYVGRDDNHYNMAQVRHILIKAVDEDGDGTYSDEEKAAAKTTAEEIYEEWKDGDATEESFAALAEEKSEDTGSNTNGGLYDSVYKGQTVDEFDEFCFAEHEYGDTAIVYGESSSYTGYHIMYYVGEGQLYSNYLAESAKRSDDYSTWQTAEVDAYTTETKLGIRFAR